MGDSEKPQVFPLAQAPNTIPTSPPQPLSPPRHPRHAGLASPSRLRSSSPHLHSPASSELFERNVQEPISIASLGGDEPAAHIPSHVVTEDLIPPALEASAQAITSQSLNPDEVEIVTSSSHQPASTVLEQSTSNHGTEHSSSMQSSILLPRSPVRHEDSASSHDFASSPQQSGFLPPLTNVTTTTSTIDDDHLSTAGVANPAASTYASLDPTDVRRLSFISFKDVVLSEHQHTISPLAHHGSIGDVVGSRESLPLSQSPPHDRAASPLRSPASTSGITTPPSYDTSSTPLSSPSQQTLGLAQQHGDLTIETMRQALRKTASGDLGARHNSGTTSGGLSPVAASAGDDVPRSLSETVSKPDPAPASIDAAVARKPIFGKESMGADASTWFE